ncbi:MAG: hypothetical protein H6Q78_1049 [Candidatus Krumholzibacteriota bacterium]|nr:hypothetical protein [Candidatus Krumholzibacteriota bacterium]
MRLRILAAGALVLLACAGSAGAIVDISVGAYYGMDIPVVNDQATSGGMYGLQAKVSLLHSLGLGLYYTSSALGEVERTFFEGEPEEYTDSLEGGDVASYGLDAYFGTMSFVPGIKFYLVGSVGQWKWERDYTEEVSEIVWGLGGGAEFILPFGVGIEGRGTFRTVPTDNDGSIKSFVWWVGANYHFGGLLK